MGAHQRDHVIDAQGNVWAIKTAKIIWSVGRGKKGRVAKFQDAAVEAMAMFVVSFFRADDVCQCLIETAVVSFLTLLIYTDGHIIFYCDSFCLFYFSL